MEVTPFLLQIHSFFKWIGVTRDGCDIIWGDLTGEILKRAIDCCEELWVMPATLWLVLDNRRVWARRSDTNDAEDPLSSKALQVGTTSPLTLMAVLLITSFAAQWFQWFLWHEWRSCNVYCSRIRYPWWQDSSWCQLSSHVLKHQN